MLTSIFFTIEYLSYKQVSTYECSFITNAFSTCNVYAPLWVAHQFFIFAHQIKICSNKICPNHFYFNHIILKILFHWTVSPKQITEIFSATEFLFLLFKDFSLSNLPVTTITTSLLLITKIKRIKSSFIFCL